MIEHLEEQDSLHLDVSMTSEGAFVFSGPGPTYIPDFIVAKATQFPTHDTTLLVIEVKLREPKEEEGWVILTAQLHEYMCVIPQQHQQDTRLVGLLICGTSVQISTLNDRGQVIVTDDVKYDLASDTGSKAIWQLLLAIAIENWTYAV